MEYLNRIEHTHSDVMSIEMLDMAVHGSDIRKNFEAQFNYMVGAEDGSADALFKLDLRVLGF